MRVELYAFILAGIVAACATVLVALSHDVPAGLWVLGGTALGGAAGLSVPTKPPPQ